MNYQCAEFQTPAFEGDALLFGAESIGLHLTGTSANAETVQWLQFAEGYLLPAVLGYVLPSVSAANFDKKTVEQYKNELNGQLQVLDRVLVKKTYLVGERLSLADVSVALDLLPAFQVHYDPDYMYTLLIFSMFLMPTLESPSSTSPVGSEPLLTSQLLRRFLEKFPLPHRLLNSTVSFFFVSVNLFCSTAKSAD